MLITTAPLQRCMLSSPPTQIWLSCERGARALGIDPKEKVIVHSDALSVDEGVRLQKLANELGLNGLNFDEFTLSCCTALSSHML